MLRRRTLGWHGLIFGLFWLPISGCAIATDVINPDFLVGLGIDPATVIRRQGVVLVAFVNQTSSPADFYAFSIANTADPRRGSRNFSTTVDAQKVRNEVVECPVEIISPGALSADYSVSFAVAAVVHEESNDVQVSYEGVPLQLGESFQCGDVVEISLLQVSGATADAQQNYLITVRRVPSAQ